MNAMGYAASLVGVRDISTGPGVYEKISREFEFPWLAANAVDIETGKPYFEPYEIITVDSLKVAVIGLVDEASASWLPSDALDRIRFEDPVKSASEWIARVKELHSPDLVVGIYQADETGRAPVVTGSQLVSKVAGFDLLFYGNEGRAVMEKASDPSGKETWILGGAARAESAALAEVSFTRETEKESFKLKSIDVAIVETENYQADPNALSFYQSVMEEVDAYVSEKIGTASESISAEKSLWEDSEYMDFIHQLQLDLTGADVSFASPVSALASIEKGTVEVRDMFRLFPREYQLYAVEMTGQEIDSYLEYSYGMWFSTLDGTQRHMLKYLADASAPVSLAEIPTELYDSAAGIFYEVDISREPGDRVTITGIGRQKKPVNPDKTYLAAVSSYRGNGGGGHLTLGAGIPQDELHDRIIFSTLQDIRLYALRLFSYIGTYSPFTDSNWSVYPEDWVSDAKTVDMDAFGK